MLVWLVAFVWTFAIELPIYHAFCHKHLSRWYQTVLLVFALNLLTHPALNFVAPRLFNCSWWEIPAEIAVALIEGVVAGLALKRFGDLESPWRVAFLAAFSANLVTALASFPFNWIFALGRAA